MYSQLSRLPARHATTGHVCLSCRRQLIAARRRQAFRYTTQVHSQSHSQSHADGDDWFSNFNTLSEDSPSSSTSEIANAGPKAAKGLGNGKSGKVKAKALKPASRDENEGDNGDGDGNGEAPAPSKGAKSDPFEQLKADLHSKIKRPPGYVSFSKKTSGGNQPSRTKKATRRRRLEEAPAAQNKSVATTEPLGDEQDDVLEAGGTAVEELLTVSRAGYADAEAVVKEVAQKSKAEPKPATGGGAKAARPDYREALEAIIAEINADSQSGTRDASKAEPKPAKGDGAKAEQPDYGDALEAIIAEINADSQRGTRDASKAEASNVGLKSTQEAADGKGTPIRTRGIPSDKPHRFSFASRIPHLAQHENAESGDKAATAPSMDSDQATSSSHPVDDVEGTEGKVSTDRAPDAEAAKSEPARVLPPAWLSAKSTSSDFQSKPWNVIDESDGKPTSLAARARMVAQRPKWGGVQKVLSKGPSSSRSKPGFDSLRQADKVSPPPKTPTTAAAAKPWGMDFGSDDTAFAASPAELAEAEAARVPENPTGKQKNHRKPGTEPTKPVQSNEDPTTKANKGIGASFEGLKKMLFGSSSSGSNQAPADEPPNDRAGKHSSPEVARENGKDTQQGDEEAPKRNEFESVPANEAIKEASQDSDEASQSLAKLHAEGPKDVPQAPSRPAEDHTSKESRVEEEEAIHETGATQTATSSEQAEKFNALADNHEAVVVGRQGGRRRHNLVRKHKSDKDPEMYHRGRDVFGRYDDQFTPDEDAQAEQPREHKPLWEVMESMPLPEALTKRKAEDAEVPGAAQVAEDSLALHDDAGTGLGEQVIDASSLEVRPLDIDGPPAPGLSYGLDRVLFNSGVHHLQDPHSRVHNFDPYLQKIMPVAEFDFNALKEYKTSSQDTLLSSLAKEHGKKFIGSTSSMTSTLSQFHYLLSNWRDLNLNMLSRSFPEERATFTQINRAPTAIFLRWKGGTYAIDADKEYDSPNVLMMLGKSMEKLLTLPKDDYERYRKSDPREVSAEEREAPEAFQFTTMGDFLMRSQLDAYDSRLPGSGMFDLKTRACLPIRMSTDDFEPFLGYEIHSNHGEYESYEREYYDMMRSTMLKYMLQARMGRMDGIFLAYHNVERIFGFQYMPIAEIDRAIHGQMDPALGDQEFKVSLEMLNQVLVQATEKFPEQSLRLHFETKPGDPTAMYIFAEPMAEEAIEKIQNTGKARVAEFEQHMMGMDKSETGAKATRSERPTEPKVPQQRSFVSDTQLSASDTAADGPFIQSIDTSTDSRMPLYAATLICAHRVNGEDVPRPSHLTSSDEWHVAYLLKEIGHPDEAWSAYESTKARRKKVMAKVASTDEEGVAEAPETEGEQNLDGGEGDALVKETQKDKKYNTYYTNLLEMVKRGRAFRRKMDEADQGQEPIVYREGAGAGQEIAPEVALGESAPVKSIPPISQEKDEVRDVESYMDWLYKRDR